MEFRLLWCTITNYEVNNLSFYLTKGTLATFAKSSVLQPLPISEASRNNALSIVVEMALHDRHCTIFIWYIIFVTGKDSISSGREEGPGESEEWFSSEDQNVGVCSQTRKVGKIWRWQLSS